MIQTLEWTPKGVRFIDQTKLPTEEVYVNCTTHQQVADVIRNMVVRGAPAIGVAAGMGIALGVQNSKAENGAELKKDFDAVCEAIRQTRPTAVNLFWAIKRMQDKFESLRIRPIAQINHARTSHAGTVRGMHFQRPPHAEMKMIRCLRGRVWDVAVDLRPDSPTFLRLHAEELAQGDAQMLVLFQPAGSMEDFFKQMSKLGKDIPKNQESTLKQLWADHGMEIMGPPLQF